MLVFFLFCSIWSTLLLICPSSFNSTPPTSPLYCTSPHPLHPSTVPADGLHHLPRHVKKVFADQSVVNNIVQEKQLALALATWPASAPPATTRQLPAFAQSLSQSQAQAQAQGQGHAQLLDDTHTPVLTTTLTRSVRAGDTTLHTLSNAHCQPHMLVALVGPETDPNGQNGQNGSNGQNWQNGQEKGAPTFYRIAALGSIILDRGVERGYPAGTTVCVYAAKDAVGDGSGSGSGDGWGMSDNLFAAVGLGASPPGKAGR